MLLWAQGERALGLCRPQACRARAEVGHGHDLTHTHGQEKLFTIDV